MTSDGHHRRRVAFLAACTPAGPPLDPTISGMQAREFFGARRAVPPMSPR
jgi:hypothetical protein